jgi:RecA/RadA recombinase
MSVEITGNYPAILRKESGLFSLDLALSSRGELGIPMRSIMELYGYTNVGKSTLSYYLAGHLTEKGTVVDCDLENADRKYYQRALVNSGLSGIGHLIDSVDDKKKPIPHEVMLGDMATRFVDEETGACILDSIGAVQPLAEKEGDFGEAFMGKRAKLVAQVSRNLVNSLRNKSRPSVAFIINHVHSVIGGRGHITAGGDTLKYLAAIRIMMWTEEPFADDEEHPIGFLVRGKVEKLRYGGRGREFTFYIVPDYGVHAGASAMFDCFNLELAERGTTVKIGKKSLGYIKKEFLEYAAEGKQRKFAPFQEELEKYKAKFPTGDFDAEG